MTDTDDTDLEADELDPIEEQFRKHGHRIAQPQLRELAADERIIRTMGLRFIVPNKFRAGDTLDESTALFINAAWHTAAINRFGPVRKELLKDPRLDYEMIDACLQEHLDELKYTPRTLSDAGSEGSGALDDGLKAVIAFGRPHFNKAVKGHSWSRPEYEEKLREWATENRTMLEDLMAAEQATVDSLIASMTGEDADES